MPAALVPYAMTQDGERGYEGGLAIGRIGRLRGNDEGLGGAQANSAVVASLPVTMIAQGLGEAHISALNAATGGDASVGIGIGEAGGLPLAGDVMAGARRCMVATDQTMQQLREIVQLSQLAGAAGLGAVRAVRQSSHWL